MKGMEININCDLGEKSELHSIENDPELLKIVNSASIACGYHAGDEETMHSTIKISKQNGVSIGAHPSFKDLENFGRRRINLSEKEIIEQTSNSQQIQPPKVISIPSSSDSMKVIVSPDS